MNIQSIYPNTSSFAVELYQPSAPPFELLNQHSSQNWKDSIKSLINKKPQLAELLLRSVDILQRNQNLADFEKSKIQATVSQILRANDFSEESIHHILDFFKAETNYFSLFYSNSVQNFLVELGFNHVSWMNFEKLFTWAFSSNILDYRINLLGIKFNQVDISQSFFDTNFMNQNSDTIRYGVDLSYANLIKLRLVDLNLSNFSFHGAFISSCDFTMSNLKYADFSNSTIEYSTFFNANTMYEGFKNEKWVYYMPSDNTKGIFGYTKYHVAYSSGNANEHHTYYKYDETKSLFYCSNFMDTKIKGSDFGGCDLTMAKINLETTNDSYLGPKKIQIMLSQNENVDFDRENSYDSWTESLNVWNKPVSSPLILYTKLPKASQ